MYALMRLSLLTLAAAEETKHRETMLVGNTTVEYVDAKAMACPRVKFSWNEPGNYMVYNSCRNHGLDATVCTVNEISLWICGAMLSGGAVYLSVAYSRIKAVKASLSRESDFNQSRALSCAEDAEDSEMGHNEYPRLLQSRKNPMSSSEYLQSHCPHGSETGAFMHSRLGILVHKHHELCANLKKNEVERQYWQAFAQILGLCNLVVPAVSIVMQGMLKVSANRHHAGKGNYVDTEEAGVKIKDYKDYDLDECARAFRQACVASFTIVAIMLQSLGKIFQPDAQSGRLEEKIARIRKDKEQFEGSVSAAGRQDEHAKANHD